MSQNVTSMVARQRIDGQKWTQKSRVVKPTELTAFDGESSDAPYGLSSVSGRLKRSHAAGRGCGGRSWFSQTGGDTDGDADGSH